FGGDLEQRNRAAVEHDRIRRERAVLHELNADRDDEVTRILHADRHVPAVAQTRLQGRELTHREGRRAGGRRAERCDLVEARAGRGLALRRAPVDEREAVLDRRRAELLLLALPGLLALLRLFPLLRLGGLLGFLFLLRLLALERLGDLIRRRRLSLV